MKGTGQHGKMKGKIRKEYYWRIRMVTKSELNAINRVEAISTLAIIPVVAYSFNIVDWKMEEIRKLLTRKSLTLERMHHPKAVDVDRMYLPRNEGGRGLIQLETACKTTTIGLNTYLNTKYYPLLVIAKEHEKTNRQRESTPQLARLQCSEES